MAENWPELAVSRAVFATPIPKTNITGFWSAGLELTNIYTIRNWTPRPTPRPIGPLQTPYSQEPGKPPEFRVFGWFPRIPGNRVLELSRQLPRLLPRKQSGKLSGKLSGQLPRLVPWNQSGHHTRPRPDASLGGITSK